MLAKTNWKYIYGYIIFPKSSSWIKWAKKSRSFRSVSTELLPKYLWKIFLNFWWHRQKSKIKDDVNYIFRFSKTYQSSVPQFKIFHHLQQIWSVFMYNMSSLPPPSVFMYNRSSLPLHSAETYQKSSENNKELCDNITKIKNCVII